VFFIAQNCKTEQIKEWQELGVVDDKFTVDNVLVEGQLSKKYEHLPIDTKYFKT